MRNSEFYFALGFEHGYKLSSESYPDNVDYKDGFCNGVMFKNKVLSLCPSIRTDEQGRRTVEFLYYLGRVEVRKDK